jgi:hypothetical protein
VACCFPVVAVNLVSIGSSRPTWPTSGTGARQGHRHRRNIRVNLLEIELLTIKSGC